MCLVEDDDSPFDLLEAGDLALEESVAGDHDFAGPHVSEGFGSVALSEGDGRLESDGVGSDFVGPVGADGGWSDDEDGTLLCLLGDEGERLDGLSESHVIGKYSSESIGGEY